MQNINDQNEVSCDVCDDGYYWNSDEWTCDKCTILFCK